MTDTSRGPKRWDRAAKHAADQPESPHARRYQARVAAANAAANLVGEENQGPVFDFVKTDYSGKQAIEFRVCSPYCAALQIQLETQSPARPTKTYTPRGTLTQTEVVDIVWSVAQGSDWCHGYDRTHSGTPPQRMRKHDPSRQTKNVRCFVCAATIQPNGYVWPVGTDPEAGEPFETITTADPRHPTQQLERYKALAEQRLAELMTACNERDAARTEAARLRMEIDVLRRDRAEALRLRDAAVAKTGIDKEALTHFYTAVGEDNLFVALENVLVIQEEDVDKIDLLNFYSTANLRKRYLSDHGGFLGGVL